MLPLSTHLLSHWSYYVTWVVLYRTYFGYAATGTLLSIQPRWFYRKKCAVGSRSPEEIIIKKHFLPFREVSGEGEPGAAIKNTSELAQIELS